MTPLTYAVSLVLKTDDPEGPGWYMVGIAQAGETGANLRPVKVNKTQAEEIARAFEGAVHPDLQGVHPYEIIREGYQALRDDMTNKIKKGEDATKKAEEEVARVDRLKRSLAELGS